MSSAQLSPPSQCTLQEQGFAVLPGVLGRDLLEDLRVLADRRLAAEEKKHFESFRFHGSMLPLDPLSDPLVRRLVANEPTLRALGGLGFAAPKWLSAYLISKPPGGPSLWWHQDWWAWDETASFAQDPPQLFVMYYLRDVDERNGALRVIPGSHRSPHPLHRSLPPAHSEEINSSSEHDPAHDRQPDEITVPARAGDAVVGDVRLLHATHANESEMRRTCLTLWYLPVFEQLPSSIKAYVVDHPALPPRGWWKQRVPEMPKSLNRLLPTYDGDATPAAYNRQPPVSWAA